MRFPMILTFAALLGACGQSNEERLQEAANQSDPVAAAVLNNAAEAGTPPQEALQEAGNAAAEADARANSTTNGQ